MKLHLFKDVCGLMAKETKPKKLELQIHSELRSLSVKTVKIL